MPDSATSANHLKEDSSSNNSPVSNKFIVITSAQAQRKCSKWRSMIWVVNRGKTNNLCRMHIFPRLQPWVIFATWMPLLLASAKRLHLATERLQMSTVPRILTKTHCEFLTPRDIQRVQTDMFSTRVRLVASTTCHQNSLPRQTGYKTWCPMTNLSCWSMRTRLKETLETWSSMLDSIQNR